jgi:3-phosphoglycerate kinase
MIPSIESVEVSGKKVLVRVDMNTPIVDGKITDPYRIDQIISTIDDLRLRKAKVLLMAHTESKDNKSLWPMFEYLKGFMPIVFAKDFFTKETKELVDGMNDGDVLLFENLRINEGEKANDIEFAKQLASYGDIYVNEAFSVSHRSHASIVGVPQFLPHYAGPLFLKEVENISKAFTPSHPFVFILGGAKFDTKLPLITKYLTKADCVFVGGALANNVFKTKGYEVGTSLVSEGDFGIESMIASEKFMYPLDVVVETKDKTHVVKDPSGVSETEYIGDAGPKTIDALASRIKDAKLVVWNGPLGNYEAGYTEYTEKLAHIIADSQAISIVGGGDTLASIEKLGLMDTFTFVSTAGGAMLDFLVNETLPGIEALTS